MSRITFSESEIRTYYEARLPKVRKYGKELRAACPIHKGTRESLAIDLSSGQWYCHSACNRGGSIFDFETELSGTNGKSARAAVLAAVGRSEPERRIVATYDYTDEHGVLLHQTVRYEPKDFSQRRPNNNGGWIWNLKDVRKVLYHLPAVMAAPIVFISEGETDADALTELGVVATTSPMGAGKWRPEYAEFLRGKQVIVLPDGDEKGRAHAADVVGSLRGVATSVKLVELPGAKDAAEWMERGGTLEALIELEQAQQSSASRQPESEPASTEGGDAPAGEKTKAKPSFTYANVPCVWDYESEVRYIVHDLVPEGCITLITGDSGHGKTIFVTALAGAIVTGTEFLGRQAEQRKVIYLDRENGLALVKQHLFDLHIERTPDLIYWGHWCESPADGPASVSLLELARAEKPVLIFDSLIAFHTGDEQDASETRRFLQYFRNLAAAGATIILLHHIGKGDNARQYRGSTDIKASVDVAWLLEKLGDPAGLLKDLRLVPFKNRISTCNTIPVSFREGCFVTEQRAESNREIFERLVRTNPNSTGVEIHKLGMAAGLPKNRIAQLLVDGVQQGWLQMKSGKQNAKYYSLAEPTLGEI